MGRNKLPIRKRRLETKLRKIIYQLLLIFCMLKKKKIYPAYVSKHSPNCEKQVILLMFPNGKGWY